MWECGLHSAVSDRMQWHTLVALVNAIITLSSSINGVGFFWTIWTTINFSGRPLFQAVTDVRKIMKLKIVVLWSSRLLSKKWGTNRPHRNLQFINLIFLLELHGYIHSMITCIYYNVTIKPCSRYSPSSHDSGSYPFQRLCHWSNAVDVSGGGASSVADSNCLPSRVGGNATRSIFLSTGVRTRTTELIHEHIYYMSHTTSDAC